MAEQVSTSKSYLFRLSIIGALLTSIVIVVGAYTRLTDAGLGCPDWPGCYGFLTTPSTEQQLQLAAERFPDSVVEPTKAWTEMFHRYLAGSLGLLLLVMFVLAWRQRANYSTSVLAITATLVGLVIFQALLGMWTVTELLLPIVVMAHLLGGMTILSLIWWLCLRLHHCSTLAQGYQQNTLRPWVLLGLIVVVLQIVLGGWVSANYAALVCPSFPFCYSNAPMQWDFVNAFDLTVLKSHMNNPAMATIHMLHRIGALIVAIFLLLLSIKLLKTRLAAFKGLAIAILVALSVQIMLGIINVVANLAYLSIATAHNGVAALLLLLLVTLVFSVFAKPSEHV